MESLLYRETLLEVEHLLDMETLLHKGTLLQVERMLDPKTMSKPLLKVEGMMDVQELPSPQILLYVEIHGHSMDPGRLRCRR